jgi:hypothetical protein
MKRFIFIQIVLSLFLISSCSKDDKDMDINTDEVVLKVKVGNNLFSDRKRFIVVTDDQKVIKYLELKNGDYYEFKRGSDFSGDYLHVHQIDYRFNNVNDINDIDWYITSCFDVKVGSLIDYSAEEPLGENSLKSSDDGITIKLKDIPDHDIMTRSHFNPLNTHTTSNSHESVFQNFNIMRNCNTYYICLQNNLGGKFKLESIPLSVNGEYEISLADMNQDMELFLYPRYLNQNELNSIRLAQYIKPVGFISIFDLRNSQLFRDSIRLYIPNHPLLEKRFDSYIKYNDKADDSYFYTNERIGGDLITDFEFINASMKISVETGAVPSIIKSEGDFDLVEGTMAGKNIWWDFYAKDGKSFKYPVFPEELSELNDLSNLLDYFKCELVKYPKKNISYDEVVKDKLNNPFNNYVSDGFKLSYGYHNDLF